MCNNIILIETIANGNMAPEEQRRPWSRLRTSCSSSYITSKCIPCKKFSPLSLVWCKVQPMSSPFAVQKVQKRNFQGAALWIDGPLSPGRAMAMLFPRELQLGGGEFHVRATGTTGQGDPWAKRLGNDHRARRRCGPPHRADGQNGFAGGLDRQIPRHWRARRVSWGGTAVVWVAYVLLVGD